MIDYYLWFGNTLTLKQVRLTLLIILQLISFILFYFPNQRTELEWNKHYIIKKQEAISISSILKISRMWSMVSSPLYFKINTAHTAHVFSSYLSLVTSFPTGKHSTFKVFVHVYDPSYWNQWNCLTILLTHKVGWKL